MKERKTAQIITRVTENDRTRIETEAERDGLSTSTFIRATLRRELESRQRDSLAQRAI